MVWCGAGVFASLCGFAVVCVVLFEIFLVDAVQWNELVASEHAVTQIGPAWRPNNFEG